MMGTGTSWMGPMLWVAFFFSGTLGSYMIIIPNSLELGGKMQVCITVDDNSAPAGKLTFSGVGQRYISYSERKENPDIDGGVVVLPTVTIDVPSGRKDFCKEIGSSTSEHFLHDASLNILGEIGGVSVNYTESIEVENQKKVTVIQTDKYLYQPGQTVKFRILSFSGSFMDISTKDYPIVWVTSPSQTRIAQWRNVDNSNGLVHLEMTLVEEPEEGSYRIHVQNEDLSEETTNFRVEEYVLPRFEVTIESPKYVLSRDSGFSFRVCAKYTFGQPVSGELSVRISNNGQKKCYTTITRNETFSGCKDFEVLNSEMRTVDCSIYSVSVGALLTEEGTGVEMTQSSSIEISRSPVRFKTVYNDRYMKYNLPYTLRVRAELPDGAPASGTLVEACFDGGCSNFTTNPDGIIDISVMKFDSRRIVMKNLISLADTYDAYFTATIVRYYSPSNSSLMIYAPEDELNCVPGENTEYNLQVLFSTPDLASAIMNVQVVSRNKIQHWITEEYEFKPSALPGRDGKGSGTRTDTVGVVNIPLSLASTVSPEAWVLVWYIRADGEVVSDSRELKLKKCLPNKVDFRWSVEEAQPGEQVTLSLASESRSLCSIGVVDRSTELLTPESNALTENSFFSVLNSYNFRWRRSKVNDYLYCREKQSTESGRSQYGYYTDYVDSFKMFDDTGVSVFSDLELETRPCEKQDGEKFYGPSRPFSSGDGSRNRIAAAPMGAPIASAMDYDESQPEMSFTSVDMTSVETEESSPRTDFPETWLWDLVRLPETGVSSEPVTVPDTITEWAGKVVCVHPEKGIGLSKRTTIKTFTSFFLDLTLPPSVKRGEILPVKISIFNYLSEKLPVTVSLEESSEYETLETSSADLCIGSNEMQVHTVKIRPLIIGDVNISVSAFVDSRHSGSCGKVDPRFVKRDAMIKPIVVEADGFPREKTWNRYICSDDVAEEGGAQESWEVSAPPAIVDGSDRGWVVVAGDLLAVSVENLGHLIRMPYGCGEQNMLNFAPNIFIMQYLEATKQSAPETREKLLRFMNTGYLRQLLYLRHDGSFSAFGNADETGSTWLTAFVLKSFALAREYILIDQKTINMTSKWLRKQRRPGGCFQSVGTTFSKAMRGGIKEDGSSVPLTAYVMISLLEAGEESSLSSASDAAECLRADSSKNPYILALKAYAFSLAKDDTAQSLLGELLPLALDDGKSLHWELPRSLWGSRSLEVETVGYAILAMLRTNAKMYEQEVRKLVKWITYQRNGYGGFISTQDTVIALQAMASFETHLSRGDLNAVVTVKSTGLTHSFKVDEQNKLLQQQVTVPSFPTTISLNLEGTGCTLMQAVLRYNIPEPEPSDAFGLTVSARTVRDKACVTKQVEFCASYLLSDGKSNMVVIELNLVSGYIPNKDDLKRLVGSSNRVKRYEVDGSKVSFYIDELTSERLCGDIGIIREVTVEDVKPGSVVVYDYYQPEFSLSKSYTLPPVDDCLYAV
ncbi:alpha-2-macroglobulin-like [Macrobrachium rosenbergii]|uniref:alpha-2-macroglobulin-like n=1 Tax=Macrobrachium rosenbergii TaxID=79674 RepID=UPI0034D77403